MAAHEILGATGGFPPPAAELEALGLAAVPFFTIVLAAAAVRFRLIRA